MNKIARDHLSRKAFVYVRQSTRDQLRHHHESRRRQYGLADRARRLGWTDPVVVDEDLGRSGGGSVRPGFERLLLPICEGRVGIVLTPVARGDHGRQVLGAERGALGRGRDRGPFGGSRRAPRPSARRTGPPGRRAWPTAAPRRPPLRHSRRRGRLRGTRRGRRPGSRRRASGRRPRRRVVRGRRRRRGGYWC